ncbi:envelope stress sensor histidine kinase CpxA, partial [Vibrio alginolyticus]|nr:envelope stress sensor histidine kinase CpxA [Vibrio alginolyticus]
PKINSLYGRIFAIFWFTMMLVVVAVLSLPHLDPRKSRDIPPEGYQRLLEYKDSIEDRFGSETNLARILMILEGNGGPQGEGRPRFFLTDQEVNILTTKKHADFKLKALQNFTTSIESVDKPQQRLYGRYMIAGPLPIVLAKR